MKAPTRQHIYIYDHPESKIRFLETSLRGQDWMASIVVPPAQEKNPDQYVDGLEKQFKERGFVTSRSAEADGTVSLHLHKLSCHTSVHDTIAELGLVKGTFFTLDNIGTHLSKLVGSAMHMAHYMVSEPARLFSAIYIGGDIAYSLSGLHSAKKEIADKAKNAAANGHTVEEKGWFGRKADEIKKLRDPEHGLASLSGWLAIAQSLIVIHYANNGGELNYSELKNQFKHGERMGIDAMNVKGWTAPEMNKRLLGPLDDIMRQHPIDAGAWAQILGQLSLIGASGFAIKKNRADMRELPKNEWMKALRNDVESFSTEKRAALGVAEHQVLHYKATRSALGSGINILRAMTSISAWFMLMHPAKEGPATKHFTEHPFEWMREQMNLHPERAAGLINGVASTIGLAASVIKGNKATIWAESIWLAGDAVMMLAKKDHYGGKAAQREIPLIDAATKFLQEMPVVVSDSHRKAMINDLALYLAQKTIDDKTDTSRARTAAVTDEIEVLKQSIVAGVNANLSMLNTIYDRVTSASAILLERFPPEHREALVKKLAHGYAASPGVYASEQELVSAITAHADMKSHYGVDAPSMGELSRDIAQIITESPPLAKAGVAAAIYDSLMPLMKQSRSDHIMLAKAIEQQPKEFITPTPITKNQQATHVAKLETAGVHVATRG